MNAHGGRRSRAPGIFIAGLAGASLILSGTAHAVTTPTEDANAFAFAVATARAARFVFDYDCVADDPATVGVDESLCPTGISDTPLAGFPTAGPSYGILTTGNAAFADDADGPKSTEYDWFRDVPTVIGPDVWDAQVARVDLGTATTVMPGVRLPLLLRRVHGVRRQGLQRRLRRPAQHRQRHRRPGHPDRERTGQLRRRRGRRHLGGQRRSERHVGRPHAGGHRDDVRRGHTAADRTDPRHPRHHELGLPDDLRPG